MANNYSNLTGLFTDIANAIRNKTGSTEPIIADAFPTAIDAIPSGSEDMKTVQVVVKGADPNACSVWDVKQKAWVDYTTGGVTVNVVDYLAVSPNGEVMQGIHSYIRLKDGTEYSCTGDVGEAWLVGDMMSFAVINFAYTSYDSYFHVQFHPIKAEDIDYIYISTQAD